MIKIAICDDEPIICSQLENMVFQYEKLTDVPISVSVFYSGEELCKAMNTGELPDLIFLDIELRLLSGIDVGHIIRNKMLNEISQIVYISAKQNYALELFESRPQNFLIKPLQQEKIYYEIQKIMKLNQSRYLVFKFDMKSEHYRVPQSNIMYFESLGRKIRLVEVSENGQQYWEFYGKLSEIIKQLDPENFITIHRSYLIHYLYVSTFSYQNVTLIHGQTLPISQTYRKNVRQVFLDKGRNKCEEWL